jgi:predicted SprT family Zn-dependent metalloprotease
VLHGGERSELQAIGDELAARLGIAAITVKVNTRLRTVAGRYSPDRRLIEVGEWLLSAPAHDIEGVLRHEVAHALAHDRDGERIGAHGPEWRRAALDCGATSRRCYPDHLRRYARQAPLRTFFTCASGCVIAGRRRPRRRYSRPEWRCAPHGLRFSAA